MIPTAKKIRPAIIQKWLLQKLLLKIFNNWVWIVLSVIIGFTIAWVINRYTSKIYRTRIEIVKGNPETGKENGALLFSNQYDAGRVNIKYEKAFITSLPLMEQIITSMGLQVSYYSKGRVKTTERHGHLPIKVIVDSISENIPYNLLITIQSVDSGSFQLISENEVWSEAFGNQVFPFNEKCTVSGFRFSILKTGAITNGDWLFKIRPMNEVAQSLQNSIQVTEIREGYYGGIGVSMLELSMQSALPAKDKEILNRLIEVMKSEDINRKKEQSAKNINFIDGQLVQITDSMQFIAARLRSLTLSNKELSSGSQSVFERINRFEEEKNQLLLINKYGEYLEQYLQQSDSKEILAPSTFGVENSVLDGLVAQYISSKLDQQRMNKVELSSSVFLNEQLILNNKLKDLEAMIYESIASTRFVNSSKIKELEKQTAIMFASARSVLSNEIVYSDYERLYDLNEKVFTLLMDKKAEIGIMQSSIISDYRVLELAHTIFPPLKPRTRNNYMMGLFLGLILPIGLMFVFILNKNTLLSLAELEDLISLPLAGIIGFSQNTKPLIERPKSLVSENFRSLRSNLRFVNAGKNKTLFLVTSSVSEEGKTFISANLSASLALQGKKVILIGADMRKPSLNKYFDFSSNNGLSYYLAGRAELKDVIEGSGLENLDIIHSGPTPPNPAELLSSEKMKELIALLMNQYDLIFIDTPPIGLISDAAELFPMSDSILLVTRQQKTPIGNLQHVEHFMDAESLKKTMLIFNGVKKGFGYGYYGYGYGYGYGYYDEEKKKVRRRSKKHKRCRNPQNGI
jgi:capsular exopolysaccharide synthesis family protein